MFFKKVISFTLSHKVFSYISQIVKNYRRHFIPGTLTFAAFTAAVPLRTHNRLALDEKNSLEYILKSSDDLFNENNLKANFEVLCQYADQYLPEIQWRKARALFTFAKTEKDRTKKEELIREAYVLIKLALDSDDKNFAVHQWYSIIIDANAKLDGLQSRFKQLKIFKEHILKAIELNPYDSTNWYILGSLEYALADLPWIQKKLINTVFTSPPTGTYEQGLEYLKKAEQLKESSEIWLMLGKCYLALKNNVDALKYLKKAANSKAVTEEDKKSKIEASNLVKKLFDKEIEESN